MKLWVFLFTVVLLPDIAAAQDGVARGRMLFQRQCASCHQVAQPRNGVGPTLQGVMGRAAGTVEGFSYSPALKASGIKWTAETLDAYLANPTGTVAGTSMALRTADEQQRKAIIQFLASR